MFPRLKRLQKPQKIEDFRRRYIKETRNASLSGCDACKQAISLPNKVFCGLLREKIDGNACSGCSYFDPEPSEYRLFKRT